MPRAWDIHTAARRSARVLRTVGDDADSERHCRGQADLLDCLEKIIMRAIFIFWSNNKFSPPYRRPLMISARGELMPIER